MKFKRQQQLKRTETLIGKGCKVEGMIICDTSLRIEGQVQGDIECDGDLVLGKDAIAHSKITARNVINSGVIHGAIESRGTLTIANSGQMYGDIKVASLSIASGGVFEGMSKMNMTEVTEVTAEQDRSIKAGDRKTKLHKLDAATTAQSNTGTAQHSNVSAIPAAKSSAK